MVEQEIGKTAKQNSPGEFSILRATLIEFNGGQGFVEPAVKSPCPMHSSSPANGWIPAGGLATSKVSMGNTWLSAGAAAD